MLDASGSLMLASTHVHDVRASLNLTRVCHVKQSPRARREYPNSTVAVVGIFVDIVVETIRGCDAVVQSQFRVRIRVVLGVGVAEELSCMQNHVQYCFFLFICHGRADARPNAPMHHHNTTSQPYRGVGLQLHAARLV